MQAATKLLPANSVGTKQVINHSLLRKDFKSGQLPKGAKGDRGVPGPRGAKGDTGPSTGPAGGDLSGTYPNPAIANGKVTPAKLGTLPAIRSSAAAINSQCELNNGLDCSVANNTDTPVCWINPALVTTQPANWYETAGTFTQPTSCSSVWPTAGLFEAPIAGKYSISAQLTWNTNAAGARRLALLDGTTELARTEILPAPSGHFTSQQITTEARLQAGDIVKLIAYQDSGITLNVMDECCGYDWMTMNWVAP